MLQSTWGLLKTAVGGSALGMLIYKTHSGKGVSFTFDQALWGLEVAAQSLLLICGLLMVSKKQYLFGVPLVLLAIYIFIFSLFGKGEIGYTSVTLGVPAFYPLAVSNGLLLLMGVMKLMRRS
jgi:hypothetical protein